MAEALLDTVLGKLATKTDTPAYEVLETYKGKDLEVQRVRAAVCSVQQNLAAKQHKKGHYVVPATPM